MWNTELVKVDINDENSSLILTLCFILYSSSYLVLSNGK